MATAAFWNTQAHLQPRTRDVGAEALERAVILAHIQGLHVLEVGCGSGVTACALAHQHDCKEILGVDQSPEMIALARRRAERRATANNPWHSGVQFEARDFPGAGIDDLHGAFDTVYTQRMVITLPTWEAQREALGAMAKCLRPGGRLLLVECSQEGLDSVNWWRAHVGLLPINPPAWDRYLRDAEMEAVPEVLTLEEIVEYSATYYFVSRVVYAKWEHDQGASPSYRHPLNAIGASLPLIPGLRGQGRAWIWRKR